MRFLVSLCGKRTPASYQLASDALVKELQRLEGGGEVAARGDSGGSFRGADARSPIAESRLASVIFGRP